MAVTGVVAEGVVGVVVGFPGFVVGAVVGLLEVVFVFAPVVASVVAPVVALVGVFVDDEVGIEAPPVDVDGFSDPAWGSEPPAHRAMTTPIITTTAATAPISACLWNFHAINFCHKAFIKFFFPFF